LSKASRTVTVIVETLAPLLAVMGVGVALTEDRLALGVPAAFTVWGTPADALPVKFKSPAYVALRLFTPGAIGVSVQPPATTVPVHVAVPSLTVTFPVGVPPADVTVNVIAIPWPTTDGSGAWPVIVVVVGAAFTVWATATEALPAKFPSPA
jgi:hypothetical protein